jgi:Ni,Fe-hydrogenase III large subunit
MMELERIAGHLDNLAEVARLADAQPARTRCATLREILLRASAAAFGHRLMMDCVVPGGVAIDIVAGGAEVILRALGEIASQLPTIRHLHNAGAMAGRLAGIGRAGKTLITALGVGGVVGRASGNPFDARTLFASGYPTPPRVPTIRHGDAAARQHIRLLEIEDSLRLVSSTLDALPDGPLTIALPQTSGEGIACAESVRGDVWHWLRLDHGQIAAAFPRDPGWALWPLVERVLLNATADDVDLIRTSFALPASGMDL